MTGTVPAITSPTFGWDTVFAVPVDRINAEIVKKKVSPPTLVHKSNLKSKFQMQAAFGDWSIIPEGDGPIVRMALPMTNLRGRYEFQGKPFDFNCAQATGIIEIQLNFLPHDPGVPLEGPDGKPLPAPQTGTKRHKLMVRCQPNAQGDPVAAFVTMIFDQPLSLPGARASVESAFEDWCNANLDQFGHVFAIVDLNDQIATGRWAFCKPHTTSYAIVDRIDKSGSYLGILCMTSKDPVPAVQQISAFSIPDHCESGFLISARRVLNDILKPSMMGVWPEIKADDIEIASNDKKLHLKSGKQFKLPDFTDKDGNSYTPVMSLFALEIMGDEIQIDTHTEVEVSLGIYATCSATYWYKIELGKNAKGEQILTYKQVRTPAKTPGTRHDPGIDVLKTILTVVGIVLAILMLVVDPAIGLVMGVLLTGIAVGQYEINNIETTHQGDAPGLDDLTNSITAPIVWTGARDLELHSAGMSESLQLGGIWEG